VFESQVSGCVFDGVHMLFDIPNKMTRAGAPCMHVRLASSHGFSLSTNILPSGAIGSGAFARARSKSGLPRRAAGFVAEALYHSEPVHRELVTTAAAAAAGRRAGKAGLLKGGIRLLL